MRRRRRRFLTCVQVDRRLHLRRRYSPDYRRDDGRNYGRRRRDDFEATSSYGRRKNSPPSYKFETTQATSSNARSRRDDYETTHTSQRRGDHKERDYYKTTSGRERKQGYPSETRKRSETTETTSSRRFSPSPAPRKLRDDGETTQTTSLGGGNRSPAQVRYRDDGKATETTSSRKTSVARRDDCKTTETTSSKGSHTIPAPEHGQRYDETTKTTPSGGAERPQKALKSAETSRMDKPSSSSSGSSLRGTSIRLCLRCSTRMSSLTKDPHSLCIGCRGRKCDWYKRCNECQGWSRSVFKSYLADRRLKERQGRYRVRQRVARESVASSSPLSNKPLSVELSTANIVIPENDSAVGPNDSVSQVGGTHSVRSMSSMSIISKVRRDIFEPFAAEIREQLTSVVDFLKNQKSEVTTAPIDPPPVPQQNLSVPNANLPLPQNIEFQKPSQVPEAVIEVMLDPSASVIHDEVRPLEDRPSCPQPPPGFLTYTDVPTITTQSYVNSFPQQGSSFVVDAFANRPLNQYPGLVWSVQQAPPTVLFPATEPFIPAISSQPSQPMVIH